jgi:hypothetical protein
MKRCAFAVLGLLAACTQPPVRLVTLTPQIPAGLLRCAPNPAVPEASSQAVVAEYIVALWEAGQDCRARLAAIAKTQTHSDK